VRIAEVMGTAMSHRVPAQRIGTVGGDSIEMGTWIAVPLAAAREAWEGGLS